jgi:heptosyltransferase-2
MESYGKILIVDLAYIGDLLMSTPAIENLRRAFPEAHIDIMVAPGSFPVIEHSPHVDRVITSDVKSGGWNALREEAARISKENYDLAVSFHRGHGTLLMLRMSGVRRRIGFTHGGRGFFLTDGIPFQLYRHRAWNHLRLIEKCLGIDVDYKTPTSLTLDEEAVASIDRTLNEEAPGASLAAINPNAAWPTKRWLPERFAAVADRLASEGFLPVIVGSAKETDIAAMVKSEMKSQALDFTGRTSLHELAALLSRCDVLVTNDSGPMHIGHAVGVPTVSVFGPTDPARCGPWLGKIEPVQADLDCIRCYRKRCWHLTCMHLLDEKTIEEAALGCIRNTSIP